MRAGAHDMRAQSPQAAVHRKPRTHTCAHTPENTHTYMYAYAFRREVSTQIHGARCARAHIYNTFELFVVHTSEVVVAVGVIAHRSGVVARKMRRVAVRNGFGWSFD